MGRKRQADESEAEAGDDVIRLRLLEGTRQHYNTMVSHFKRWLQANNPVHVVGETIMLPLPENVCKMYLSYVSVKRDKQGNELLPRTFNTASTVNGYKSAIKFLYKESSMEVSSEVDSTLSAFSDGYKRHVAQMKQNGTMSINEGKSPVSFSGFVFLAAKALGNVSVHNQYLNVHCFLLFSWNLMARAASVGSIRYDHISWNGDAMVVKFGLMKNDQEGKTCFPKHVFANPMNPTICPVLRYYIHLAVLVFTRGSRREGTSTLVFGANAKERFSAWLTKTCQVHRDEIVALGLSVEDLGTHSFRKGVATAITNTPGGPPMTSVWLRAGWSLGNVQGRYIFSGTGGDQFVGRCAAGIRQFN
ncbi:hypothetical protein H257_12083 [Aphanomyces astaci]|uniref:Tyr recombinase domain-containing protein n=1 Tax=Aphanomyces astaci TaxID=112090 RepID=W4G1B0_APHAT|nr:hypothetical protein H257_12083 [Aphanomyces astaci]ETV73046.1 hypothetical protein H257_12083 [Aphanomyces astaci]|eukprot:XP_009837495.1 hypothetical protein H257_12083 [Aphanomyces astaci]